MARVGRRIWLVDVLRIGAIACLGGCGNSEGTVGGPMTPKSEPPPGMKPQENFDPRKKLREKAANAETPT